MADWDQRFIELAYLVASWSKDPSTQVGAVIVRPNKTIVSTGYNGFPRSIYDDPELYANRAEKYARVVHAEANAIIMARGETIGNTLYCTLYPCSECAKLVLQSGITEVVVPSLEKTQRFYDSMVVTEQMFEEAGVVLRTP